jgi:hypothetical protein
VKVRRGRFAVKLSGCSRCTGKAAAKSKRTTAGSTRYALNASGGVTVSIKVSKAAMRLLRKARANGIPVTLTITVSNGAGSTAKATGKIRLRL